MMKWSWRLAVVRGIEIRLHATFLFALIWGAVVWGGGSVGGAFYGILLTISVFAVVLLHELGHAVAAQHYGIAVADIVLLPIGGLARLSRMPEEPRQELLIALAGPAVNLGLALVLLPLVAMGAGVRALAGGWPGLATMTLPGLLNFATFMLMINVSLLLFNMLPAFPMDGGRVLRAALALWLPYQRATDVAAVVGRFFALVFGAVGLLSGNLMLAFVGVFVFSGAGAERQDVRNRESLRGLTVTEAIDSHVSSLLADTPAHVAFHQLLRSGQPALAVVDGQGEFLGYVSRAGLERQWAAGARGSLVSFVETPALVLQCTTPLAAARARMAEVGASIVAIYCGSTFAGLLDWETIGRVAALHQRLPSLGRAAVVKLP